METHKGYIRVLRLGAEGKGLGLGALAQTNVDAQNGV